MHPCTRKPRHTHTHTHTHNLSSRHSHICREKSLAQLLQTKRHDHKAVLCFKKDAHIPDIPDAIVSMCRQCWSIDPSRRPTAADIHALMCKLLADASPEAEPTSGLLSSSRLPGMSRSRSRLSIQVSSREEQDSSDPPQQQQV